MSIQALLSQAGIPHVAVSAAKVKVTTNVEVPKGSTLAVFDFREGTTLRGRWVLEDPTKLKICNAIGRQIGRGYVEQRPGLTMTIRFSLPTEAPKGPVNILNLRSEEKIVEVKLIDKKTKNTIYALSDITGDLELVHV